MMLIEQDLWLESVTSTACKVAEVVALGRDMVGSMWVNQWTVHKTGLFAWRPSEMTGQPKQYLNADKRLAELAVLLPKVGFFRHCTYLSHAWNKANPNCG